ncbi:MAG: aryl-sulfate sulfotransferase [Candidatus Hodarchaeota archaeon]
MINIEYVKFTILEKNHDQAFNNDNFNVLNPKSDLEADIANITHLGNSFNGYNLFVLEKRNKEATKILDRFLIITDMNGKIILRRNISISFGLSYNSAEFINSTTILYGSPNATLWNLETNKTLELDFYGHHELEYNPINKTIFTFAFEILEYNGTEYGYDRIMEYNLSGSLVWSLNTTFIFYDQWCPFQDLLPKGIPDITHSNSIFFDAEEDLLYYNSKTTNTFYEINHKTKQIVWGIGEYGNYTLFDKNGNKKHCLWYHSHAVEKINKNCFILFDNDIHNQTNSENFRSRILEIVIDRETMTANESWFWLGSEEYYSGFWGDADLLPNQNRLGTFGTPKHIDSSIGARLVEINDTGNIVWEMNYPHTELYSYGIYKCERFCSSPILSSPSDLFTLEGSNVVIKWQTWYNFRAKKKINGSYALYLNGLQIKTGIHTFDKFWLSSNLTVNLGLLEVGDYNLTIYLSDEGGHKTIDSLKLFVNSSSSPSSSIATRAGITCFLSVRIVGLGLFVFLKRKIRFRFRISSLKSI